MAYIREHLVAFYDHYSNENQITTTQAVQKIDSWGLQQWKNAVDDLDVSNWLPESKQRAEVLGNYAGFNNANLMSAIAGLAVIAMIDKHVTLVTNHIDNTVQDELDLLDNAFPNSIKQQKTPKTGGKQAQNHKKTVSTSKTAKNARLSALKYATSNYAKSGLPDVSDRLWLDGDKLVDDVRSKLLNHFLRGGDLDGLNDILVHHENENQFRPDKSIADRIAQFNSISERLLRTESAMMLDYIDDYYYRENGIKWVNWVTEPGACELCLSLEAGSPYMLDVAPRRVIDSHPNCRCGKVPAEAPYETTADLYKSKKANVNSADLTESTPENMERIMKKAVAANKHGGSVDIVYAKNVKTGWVQLANKDGMAGVTVKTDGDIIGVFKNPNYHVKGVVTDLITTARAAGGTKMDCYGRFLVNSYEKAGFKPVARVPFNKEYVDDPQLLKDQPDVFMMMKTNKSIDDVIQDIADKSYKRSTAEDLSKLPTIEDYDEAMNYRDQLLRKQEKGDTK